MLTDCHQFKNHPHKEKVDFLKINGYCFGCLMRGHMSRNCRKRLTCQTCQKSHPTILHIDSPLLQKPPPTETKGAWVNRALVSAGEATGAGRDCALAIVPVRVKVDKGDKFISTYAVS